MNVLIDPIILMQNSDGTRVRGSLPDTYAALMQDEVDAFPALRPHQRHAWHAFLVQLGAMAMHQEGITDPPEDAAEWQRIIRALTPDYPDDEPWQLVVDDITMPAFMQPPASSKDKQKDFKPRDNFSTPDELDMLVTTKAHDIKPAIAANSSIDDWLFALITLQTMEGFMGVGNYGISRMNGGASSRPSFSITPSERPGIHLRRDITALLPHHDDIARDFSMSNDGGIGLLWTVPWDGTKQEALIISNLSPFYIDVCRRIRLRTDANGSIYGTRTTSKAARIDAKALKGRTGDPWTPVNRKESKALTLAKGGFLYRRVMDYLTPADWEKPSLLKPTQIESRSDETMQLIARAMVRGQGKTEGYYERVIPIRHKARGALMSRTAAQTLGDISKIRIAEIGKVQQFLRHAISVFLAGGDSADRDSNSRDDRARARSWANRLDEIVDATFFDDLQTEFEADSDEDRRRIRREWGRGVYENALGILKDAQESLPCPAIKRYKARVCSNSVFEGRMRSNNGNPDWFAKGDE